jgi:arsenate reductase
MVETVCDSVREACPTLPGAEALHWPFPDPAHAEGSEPEKLAVFRNVREQIRKRIQEYPGVAD